MKAQREHAGVGSLRELAGIVAETGARRVALVTGRTSFRLSGAKEVLSEVLRGVEVHHFDQVSENPALPEIRHGIDYFSGRRCELMVAVGGGSVLDTAKLLKGLAGAGDPLAVIQGREPLEEGSIPLVAVPTTSGSGSEATEFAVVYVERVKYSLSHPSLLPDFTILDPSLTYSMTPKLTADSGMDALSQAIESYWSVRATAESLAHAERAIKLLLPSVRKAVNDPDPQVRQQMALGANAAGKAINISKTTAPHALSYALTANYGVPHGHAVALTLGKFILINGGTEESELVGGISRQELKARMERLYALLGCRNAAGCHDLWYRLMSEVGLTSDLRELGVRGEKDIGFLVDSVNAERLANNPVQVTLQELVRVFGG